MLSLVIQEDTRMNTFYMLTSVFYKEIIKTRFIILALLVFNLCYMVWNFIGIRRLFQLDHSEVVWYRVMELGQIPYQDLTFIPIITAALFCCFQFLQEMRDARIRISLHAPCDSSLMVLFHAFFGIVFLLGIFAIDITILLSIVNYYFPREVAYTAFINTLPWFIAGFFVYLGGAFVLLEPLIKRKILGTLITFTICSELLLYSGSAYYSNILWIFILLLPCMLYSIPVSTDDYRNRWTA